MKIGPKMIRTWCAALGCLIAATSMGCQTTIGGQTLPSAWFLRDDVQYFPPGEEDLVPNLRRELKEYNVQQSALAQ